MTRQYLVCVPCNVSRTCRHAPSQNYIHVTDVPCFLASRCPSLRHRGGIPSSVIFALRPNPTTRSERISTHVHMQGMASRLPARVVLTERPACSPRPLLHIALIHHDHVTRNYAMALQFQATERGIDVFLHTDVRTITIPFFMFYFWVSCYSLSSRFISQPFEPDDILSSHSEMKIVIGY